MALARQETKQVLTEFNPLNALDLWDSLASELTDEANVPAVHMGYSDRSQPNGRPHHIYAQEAYLWGVGVGARRG